MRFRVNSIIQILGIVTHGAVTIGGALPGRAGQIAMTIAAVAQAASGVIAHWFNPDGTPAQASYRP